MSIRPYIPLPIYTSLSATGIKHARDHFIRHFGFEPDTLFIGPQGFSHAHQILDMNYEMHGFTLNRWVCNDYLDGEWSVGFLGPMYGYGSTGA